MTNSGFDGAPVCLKSSYRSDSFTPVCLEGVGVTYLVRTSVCVSR